MPSDRSLGAIPRRSRFPDGRRPSSLRRGEGTAQRVLGSQAAECLRLSSLKGGSDDLYFHCRFLRFLGVIQVDISSSSYIHVSCADFLPNCGLPVCFPSTSFRRAGVFNVGESPTCCSVLRNLRLLRRKAFSRVFFYEVCFGFRFAPDGLRRYFRMWCGEACLGLLCLVCVCTAQNSAQLNS